MTKPIKRTRSANSLEGMLPPPDVEGSAQPDGGMDPAFLQQNRLAVDQTQRNVRNLQSKFEQLSLRADDIEEILNAPKIEEEETQIKLQEGANITITQRGNTFIISSSASDEASGDTYRGHFKITDNGDDTMTIGAGRVVNGTTTTTVPADTGSVSGATYLSIEIWYNSGWHTTYLASSSYPTQAKKSGFWTLRVLIAEKVNGSWVQQQFGEIHNTRLVS